METVIIEAASERAEVLPGFGCQCVRYSVGRCELIAGPPNLDALAAHPHRFGIPVLFPWPGRVAGARFDWGTHHLDLPITEPTRGHAIHGVVSTAAFEIVRQGPYFLTCRLDWTTQPAWRQGWPFPFCLTLDYEVGNGLRIRATVENLGSDPMPFGLGFHPYFNSPLPGSARQDVTFRLPVRNRMLLDASLIPTGARQALADNQFTLAGAPFDDLYADGAPDPDGKFRAMLTDPALGAPLCISADPAFATWVAFTPPGRAALAIEPYTCAPDPFHLTQRGIPNGLLELAAGKTWQGLVEIGLAAPAH